MFVSQFRRNCAVLTVLILLVLVPSGQAFAHARWFVEQPKIETVAFEFGLFHLILAALTAAFLLALFVFDIASHRLRVLHGVANRRFAVPHFLDWRLMAMVFGAVLILNSMEHVFLAPNLAGQKSLMLNILLFLQILFGAMLVTQARITEAALSLLALPLIGLAVFSLQSLVDYAFEVAAVGVSLYLVSPVAFERDRILRRRLSRGLPHGISLSVARDGASRTFSWALPFRAEFRGQAAVRREVKAVEWLRVMLGAQLVVLAAHDKLLYPGVSLAFVDMYPFVNFPALLGLNFSNLDFVYAAGLAETAFGLALMFNLATRAISLAMLALFTVTGIAFGLSEMAGHLPILAILAVIFIHGSGHELEQRPAWDFPKFSFAPVRLASVAALLAGIVVSAEKESAFAGAQNPAVPRPAAEAATPLSSAAVDQSALVVPKVLFENFTAAVERNQSRLPAEVARKVEGVRSAFAVATQSERGTRPHQPDKDEIASALFDLSISYEAGKGRDAAADWIRYAHLTASCTPDEVQAMRTQLGSSQWLSGIKRAPAPLREALMPLAAQAARGILGREIDQTRGFDWASVAMMAPASGTGYVHTHTLAAVARILTAASADQKPGVADGAVGGVGNMITAAPVRGQVSPPARVQPAPRQQPIGN